MSSMFLRLLQLEMTATLRQPLTWWVCIALLMAIWVGVATGAKRVERERATIASLKANAARSIQEAKAAAQRYSTPSDLKIDYHRDPTDAFGYMNYFLVTHAVKPPLPLAAMAAGQAQLQPFQIRIDFTALFPDAAFDPGPPQELKLGAFDLSFVMVYLVPLALIALSATRLTSEQDSGILRLIAAQPTPPRTVAVAKYTAITLTALVCIVGGVLLALWAHGQLVVTPPLFIVILLVSLWVLLWVASSALVATLWRGAIASIVTLVLLWGAVTVLMPSVMSMLVELIHPAPSRIGYIDASRRSMDEFYAKEAAISEAWLAQLPGFEGGDVEMAKAPEVKRFARDDFYRKALSPQRQRFDDRARAVLDTSDRIRLLSPAMMLDEALQALSGTDARRHVQFLAAADAYSEALRRYFEPIALANAARPQRSCSECPGRLNFTHYDDVPTFDAVTEEAAGLRRGAFASVYMCLVAVAIGLLARARLLAWPVRSS